MSREIAMDPVEWNKLEGLKVQAVDLEEGEDYVVVELEGGYRLYATAPTLYLDA